MNITATFSSAMKRAAPVSAKSGRRMKRSTLAGTRISALRPLPSPMRASCRAMVKPRLGMNGNGWAGSTASGVRIGKMWPRKYSSSQTALVLGQVLRLGEDDAFEQKLVAQLGPALLLVGGKVRRRPRRSWPSCSAGVRPSGLLGDHVLADLADQAGDADHEELVEIVGRDRQEPQLLEQRMVLVRGLLQHAPVELQPGQLAVDEALGSVQQRRCRRARPPPKARPAARASRTTRRLRRTVLARPLSLLPLASPCRPRYDEITTIMYQKCLDPRESATTSLAMARVIRRPRAKASAIQRGDSRPHRPEGAIEVQARDSRPRWCRRRAGDRRTA